MRALWLAAIFFLHSQLPDLVEPGAVTGRLVAPNGTPATGVRIAAVPAEDKTGAAALFGITQTDDNGRYRIEKIQPGRYYIFAGLIDTPNYYPNTTRLDRATAITVYSGTTTSEVNFSLVRPVSMIVGGHLMIPPTLQFSDGWSATLTPLTRGVTGSVQSKVGRDGSFEFSRVAPGEYRVSSNVGSSTPVSVTVTDTDLQDVILAVVDCNAGLRVSGRLVGKLPPEALTISLQGARSPCSARASVAQDGSFTFASVAEGTYQVQLSPAPLGWSSEVLYLDKSNAAFLEISLPPLISLRGIAETEDGSAFPRTIRGDAIPIRAVGVRGGETSAIVQSDGTFELSLARGDYRISVPGIPAAYYLKSVTAGLTDLSTSTFHVGDGLRQEIRLTLGFSDGSRQKGVRVTGHLTFAITGALLNPESVRLIDASEKKNPEVRESVLSPDGTFEFGNVQPGTYNLETFPDNPVALHGIVVSHTDVTGIEYTLPVLVRVHGGVEWAGSQGIAAPSQPEFSIQFTRKEGDRMLAWGALARSGSFHFYLPEGDYRFSVSGLPFGFDLGAVTLGNINILESGLRVRSDSEPPALRVVLRGK
jgi:hypothetical protein